MVTLSEFKLDWASFSTPEIGKVHCFHGTSAWERAIVLTHAWVKHKLPEPFACLICSLFIEGNRGVALGGQDQSRPRRTNKKQSLFEGLSGAFCWSVYHPPTKFCGVFLSCSRRSVPGNTRQELLEILFRKLLFQIPEKKGSQTGPFLPV